MNQQVESTGETIEELFHTLKLLEAISGPVEAVEEEEAAQEEETDQQFNQVIEAPSYGPTLNKSVSWQASSPIVLYKYERPKVNIR